MRRFADFFYQSLRRSYESDIREGVGISQIGYCELKTQRFYIDKNKPDIPPDRLLAMLTGTATHEKIFSLLWKYRGELPGFTYRKKEMEVVLPTPKGRMIGHLDLLAEIDGEPEVADLKVVDFGPFGWIDSERSREHEYDQINCYAAAAGIKRCRLIYLSKGGKTTTANVKEYPFPVDLERVEELKLKYDRIMAGEAVKPFKDPGESWECNVCPYYSQCWGIKTAVQKQEGVEEIPQELEEKYIAVKAALDEYKAQEAELREQIAAQLQGKRGEGSALSAIYVKPYTYQKFDTKKLKLYIDDAKLKECAKDVDGGGYYKMQIRGE